MASLTQPESTLSAPHENLASETNPRSTTRTVCLVFTLGCPRAEADTGRLYEYIRANGWSVAVSIEAADVVIVMTCGYSGDYEERSISLLQSIDSRRRPDSQLIVVGCLAGINEERLLHTFNAVVAPPKRLSDLDAALGATVPFASVPDPGELEPYIAETSAFFSEADRHPGDNVVMRQARNLSQRVGVRDWVLRTRGRCDNGRVDSAQRVCSIRVAAGCPGECTYCAIKFAAGPLHSKPLDDVLTEFDRGLARGFKQFRFIAGDLGSYGQDIGSNVAELLGAVFQRPGDFKLTLLDFDLKYFIQYADELIRLFAANCARVRCIDIPMQSGSEQVLGRMRRGHTAADAEHALRRFRAVCPDIVVTTHVMVGFPGETEADFEDSLRLLRVGQFNEVTFYDYQDRPRTEASRMLDKIPQSTIRERSLRAHREFNGRFDALRYRAKAWGLR